MAVPDLILRQKFQSMSVAINVKTMLADFFGFVTPKTMHKARFSVLLDALTALAKDARCTVTAIGRAMPGTSDKVSIKRADRLLSNTHLQQELPLIYAAMTRSIVSSKSQPLILVDWSNADTAKRHFILRASMATDGRALTLLQKVAAAEAYISRRVAPYKNAILFILNAFVWLISLATDLIAQTALSSLP